MNPSPLRPRLDRRTAIKWMLTASSALMIPGAARGQATRPPLNQPPGPAGPAQPIPPLPSRPGYGTDPDLVRAYQMGDYWPLTLTEEQRQTVAVLCDVILPADERSPAPSALGVPDFIDEWISAPYPNHGQDRILILTGLGWLDEEAHRRFGRPFSELAEAGHQAICDDICTRPPADPVFAQPADFFSRFRHLTLGGFFSTPEGMRDLRYVGNLPTQIFEGPTPEVLARLGLTENYPAQPTG